MLTTVAAGRIYNFSHVVGKGATADPGFLHPIAIDIDQNGVVYVISRGGESAFGSRMSKFAIGAPGDEALLGEFGHYGESDGQLMWPTSVAVDRESNAYVADEWLQRISIFDKDGNFLDKWGTQGHADGELNGPSGMVFDREDNLYIVDSGNNRVQKFTKEGSFLAKFGEEGSVEGQFNLPWGITIDNQGDIYVADWGNHRVQKFSSEGVLLSTFGTLGSGVGELSYPTDAAVDGEGDVYVADWANSRVQIFVPDGDVITSLYGDAHELSKWAQESINANPDMLKARRRVKSLEPELRLLLPSAVAFDEARDLLLITDSQRNRLQIYIKDKDCVGPQFNL